MSKKLRIFATVANLFEDCVLHCHTIQYIRIKDLKKTCVFHFPRRKSADWLAMKKNKIMKYVKFGKFCAVALATVFGVFASCTKDALDESAMYKYGARPA